MGEGREAGFRLARAYLILAHLSLALVCLCLIIDSRGIAGFHYHPRALALVHGITLGWVTPLLLACLLLILSRLPERAASASLDAAGVVGARGDVRSAPAVGKVGDWIAFIGYALALSGMLAHFWIGEASGVGWSGLVIGLVVLRLVARCLMAMAGDWRDPTLGRSGEEPSRTLLPYIFVALFNLGLSLVLGLAMVMDRYVEVLPGHTLSHVYAHAHLATLGWAGLLMAGLSARSRGAVGGWGVWVWQGSALLLALGFLFGGAWQSLATLLAAALLLSLCRSLGGIAAAWLLATLGLGLCLYFLPWARAESRLILAYGVLALLGFLGQGLLDLQHRLLAASRGEEFLRQGWLRSMSWLWAGGVLILALSFACSWISGLVLGALLLLSAIALSARTLLKTRPTLFA